MQMSELKSCRYQPAGLYDRFTGTRIFVEEARKYSSVLECGCSSGFVSRLISKDGGPSVVGIEYDREAAAEARKFCQRVLNTDLNRPGWSAEVGGRFDLITFGDVLEHLVDPSATLREAKQLLNPGGRILISLPNIAHWSIRAKLLLGRWDYQPTGLMDYTHLRFFTTVTGRRMIEEAGYKIIFSHPVVGGRFTSRLRAGWQTLTNLFPNLLAVQMIFLAEART
jgi:2-polyprenyl-3-methyl-5-hydroxy-6-metoxy-1,4-benzoquinol methylase